MANPPSPSSPVCYAKWDEASGEAGTTDDQPTKQKLWGGRFTGATDPLWVPPPLACVVHRADPFDSMHAFNQSLRYDQRMHTADIRGSIAYAKALTRVGILTAEEETQTIAGLQAVEKEWERGQVRRALP